MIKTFNLGYKYRLYPTIEQIQLLNHQMFVYNQAYNICLNLWKKEQEKNKNLPKEQRVHRKAISYDAVVKRALKFRKIPFKTVVTQQARMNFLKAVDKAFSKDVVAQRLKAIEEAQTPREKAKALNLGMPKFKSSKDVEQSFNWNNQGYSIIDTDNKRFKILRVMKQDFKVRWHRDLPDNAKIKSITFSKDVIGYYVSFNIEFEKEIDLEVSIDNLDISKSIGIDLNGYNIALSQPINNNHLIDNGANNRKVIQNTRIIKILQRKQSRRVRKWIDSGKKGKIGKNFKKTQRKLNKKYKKLTNQKIDLYHKVSKTLTDKFDLIAVEDLKVKNMSKSAKGNKETPGKNVKAKAGLNKTILNASFYQFQSMLEYKSKLNGKLFVKVDPKYTSLECSVCGNRDKANRPKQDYFKCTKCGYETNPDIQSSKTILKRALESFGIGTILVDLKHKASHSVSLETVS
jgi:putative transposase